MLPSYSYRSESGILQTGKAEPQFEQKWVKFVRAHRKKKQFSDRAGQSGGGGRQRRYSNSFEDRDFVQRIEDRNTDPVEQNTKDPYKRLSANAKRFNYLHKVQLIKNLDHHILRIFVLTFALPIITYITTYI